MAATLLDYKTSEPSNVQGAGVLPGGVAIPATIAMSPEVTVLADIGVFSTVAPNRVELEATIGVEGITGVSTLSFTILRDGVQIFQTTQGVETGYEQFYTVTLEGMDYGVSAGFHKYVLQVSNLTAETVADVVGPVLFTGAAYLIS